MNKRHWISLAPGPGVSRALISELVTNAYLLVTDALTQQQRAELCREQPTDAARYARGGSSERAPGT